MKKLLSILLFVLICSTPLFSQPLSTDPTLRKNRLPNGLTYYIKKNSKPANRVELRIAMNVGAIDEDDDQNGLAHFAEHICFNGSKHFPQNGMIDFIQSIGMDFGSGMNAFTSYDMTVYNLVVPTDSQEIFDKGLLVLRDWAQDVLFEDEEIDKERGVIIEEWRGGRGARERMRRQHFTKVFYGSKYAKRNIIGSKEVLESFPHQRLKDFYHDWFRPDLQAIIIVGDIDVDKVEKQVVSLFSDLKNPAKPRAKEIQKLVEHQETIYSIVTDPEATKTEAELIIKLPVKSMKTAADYQDMLAGMMGLEMLNSRLTEISQQSNAPFISGSVGRGMMIRPSIFFMADVTTKEDGIKDGVKALLSEITRVEKFGFNQSEFERMKEQFKRNFQSQLAEKDNTESETFVWQYISNYYFNDPLHSVEQEYSLALKLIDKITLKDVEKEFNSYLPQKNRVLTVSMPQKDSLPVVTEAELKEIVNQVKNSKLTNYVDVVVTKPFLEKEPVAGSVVSTTTDSIADLKVFKLSNNATVIYKKTDFKADQVLFNAFSKGGISRVADNEIVPAQVAASLITQMGLGEYDNIALQKYLSGKLVSINPYIDMNEEGFNGNFSPNDVKPFFELLHAYFVQPRKDTKAYDNFMENFAAHLKNRALSPEKNFEDSLKMITQNYNPRVQLLNYQNIDKVNLEKCLEIYQNRFSGADDFTFVFVGNIAEDKLIEFVNKYIASLPMAKQNETVLDHQINPPMGIVNREVYQGLEQKSRFEMILHSDFEFRKENLVAASALNDILNEKLRENIREKMSGVYSVYSQLHFEKEPEEKISFNITLGCSPERVAELKGAIIQILDSLANYEVEAKYLEQSNEQVRRYRETGLKTNEVWQGIISNYTRNGMDLKTFVEHTKYLDKLNLDLIRQTAKKYLDTQKNLLTITLFPQK